MPRYYFDSEYGDSIYRDVEGLDLASLEVAQRHAEGLARDITYGSDLHDGQRTLILTIRCGDEVVLSNRMVGGMPAVAPLAAAT